MVLEFIFVFFLVCDTSLCVQILILSRALEDDVSRGFVEIQKRVDAEQAHNEALSAERDALADREKAPEAHAAGFEEDRAGLQHEVWVLRGARTNLKAERDPSEAGAVELHRAHDLGGHGGP